MIIKTKHDNYNKDSCFTFLAINKRNQSLRWFTGSAKHSPYMNSQHAVIISKQPTLIVAGLLLIYGSYSSHSSAATPELPPATAVASVSTYTQEELNDVRRAEPALEIRAAIPVNRSSSSAVMPTLDLSKVTGYIGHRVGRNETLETIALNAGSTPQLLSAYNRLSGPLQRGREIIVPRPGGEAPEAQSTPVIVERGLTNQPVVALTFDAGSTAEPLPKLLQTLRDHHLKVTFFVTGFWVRENPELLRQIVADGHELGNHSLTHPDMRNQDDMRIKHELLETERLVRNASGSSTRPYFRPPYGAYNNRVLLTAESLGYLPVYWTLDCLDSVGAKKSPEFIAERVTRKLSREQLCGAIILMHVDSMATADAVPTILSRYDEMGLSVVTVSKVLNETASVAVSSN